MKAKKKIKVLRRGMLGAPMKSARIRAVTLCESSLPAAVRALELVIDHDDCGEHPMSINSWYVEPSGRLVLWCSKGDFKLFELEFPPLPAEVQSMLIYGKQYSAAGQQQVILFVPGPRSKQQWNRCGLVIASTAS